jgi:hypothetical protein
LQTDDEISSKERDEVSACEAAAGLPAVGSRAGRTKQLASAKRILTISKHAAHDIAKKNEYVLPEMLQKDFHSSLWNNMARCGLMSDRAVGRSARWALPRLSGLPLMSTGERESEKEILHPL